jgi:hypothetical protein
MVPWKCSCCGEVHDSLPDSFGFEEPYYWGNNQESSASDGCWIDGDYCVIDGSDYFIRAVLELPIHGSEEPFVIGAWTTLSQSNFERERQLASDPLRLDEPAYFGWFANWLWQFPNTLNLKCNVISRPPGQRPCIELEPTDHLLSIEQRNGISQERFQELSAQFLHGWKHPDSGIEP